MIIRFGKFEATVICILLITVTFIFAVSTERNAVEASTQQYESVEVPVIMYHHITESRNKTGKYTVHTEELMKDLDFLQKRGYTTVTVADLIAFVNGEKALPEKPVMITFDDGFESFYCLAYPLLKERKMKSVVSVIGKVTERYSEIEDHNINYSNMTFGQINELIREGLVEIQNHSYDMHFSEEGKRKGLSKMSNESDEEYKKKISEDLLTLQKILKLNCGITPICVVYPYGAYSKDTLEAVKKLGFKSTMVCEERINTIVKGDENSLFNLGRYNRPSGITSEEFFLKALN